jgi:asparagine synthase (glutamine-hydrolysing)
MFAGWVFSGREAVPPTEPHALAEALLRRLAPLRRPDVAGRYVGTGAVLAQALNWNTSESQRETVPTVCPHTGNVLVSWLRLDNREELGSALRLSASDASDMTDPDYVLAAYRQWGTDTARHLEGDFAFAVFEPLTRRVYLARDPMGIRSLFYAHDRDNLTFSTTQACFHEFEWVDSTLSKTWLAFYLANLAVTSPAMTALSGVTAVLPGHQVTLHDGHLTETRYHEFCDDPPWTLDADPRFVREYREEFLGAVRRRIRSAYLLGAENSGGLDCASILAAFRALAGADAPFETFGMSTYAEDEAYMRLAVEGTGFGLHIFAPTGEGRMRAAMAAGQALGHPPADKTTYHWHPFVERATELGARTLLSGNGGDDAVTIGGNLVLRELALRKEWKMLSDYLSGSRPIGRAKALRYMARQQRRDRSAAPLTQGLLQGLVDRRLRLEAMEELGVVAHLESMGRWMTPYDTLNSFIIGDRLSGYPTCRASEANQVGHGHKLENRYPMLDRRLIQRFLSTPAIEKFGKNSPRHLHRRAMAGYLDGAFLADYNKYDVTPPTELSRDFGWQRVTVSDLIGSSVEKMLELDKIDITYDDSPSYGPRNVEWVDIQFRLAILFSSREWVT